MDILWNPYNKQKEQKTMNWKKTIGIMAATVALTLFIGNLINGNFQAKMGETIEASYNQNDDTYSFSHDPNIAYKWEEFEPGQMQLVEAETGIEAPTLLHNLAVEHDKWRHRVKEFPKAPEPTSWCFSPSLSNKKRMEIESEKFKTEIEYLTNN